MAHPWAKKWTSLGLMYQYEKFRVLVKYLLAAFSPKL
jgi:hypothetical protein